MVEQLTVNQRVVGSSPTPGAIRSLPFFRCLVFQGLPQIPSMLFEKIFQLFQDRGIRYLIVGGVAVNLHGFARATADLDLLISLDQDNVQKFILSMQDLGWRPRAPVPLQTFADPQARASWIREKQMKAFAIYNPKNEIEHLDILLTFENQFADFYQRRNTLSARDIQLPVISLKDLILMKKAAGRERDQIDIRALEEIERIEREGKGKAS